MVRKRPKCKLLPLVKLVTDMDANANMNANANANADAYSDYDDGVSHKLSLALTKGR